MISWIPDRIVYHTALRRRPKAWERAQAIFARYPHLRPQAVDSMRAAVPDGDQADVITWGKRTLFLTVRSGAWVHVFENKERGAFCPRFYELSVGTQCPYDCHYCFLQLTFRNRQPMITVYLDWEKMEAELQRIIVQERPRPLMFNAGELCDPLALDPLTGLSTRLVRFFAAQDRASILFLTKSTNVEALCQLKAEEHRRRAILSWSLNCEAMIRAAEPGTASLTERLEAARAAQAAGYRVRVRLDPLIAFEGWEGEYTRLVDSIYEHIRPEMVTLGSFRMLKGLATIIKNRFPNSLLHEARRFRAAEKGVRERYPLSDRLALYRHVLRRIRAHDAVVPVSLCKEDETVWVQLEREGFVRAACNCVPYRDWQAESGGDGGCRS